VAKTLKKYLAAVDYSLDEDVVPFVVKYVSHTYLTLLYMLLARHQYMAEYLFEYQINLTNAAAVVPVCAKQCSSVKTHVVVCHI
jgi:hypothetical protein